MTLPGRQLRLRKDDPAAGGHGVGLAEDLVAEAIGTAHESQQVTIGGDDYADSSGERHRV